MEQIQKQALQALQKAIKGGEIQDGAVLVQSKQLSISVRVEETDEKDGLHFAALTFSALHPRFEEPIENTAAGTGKTQEEAIQRAISAFLVAEYDGIERFLDNKTSFELTTDFFGEEKQWKVSQSNITGMGEIGASLPVGFWNILNRHLVRHLGARRLYYVKAYASKQPDGRIICECRVNNMPSEELASLLEPVPRLWKEGVFCSQKQTFFIEQKPETYKPYSFSKKRLQGFVTEAVKLYDDCDTEEKFEKLREQLILMTADINLSCELQSFLPEICAMCHYRDLHFAETVVVIRDGEEFQVYKDQFTSYSWIVQRLMDGFTSGEYSMDVFRKLVLMSATYSTVEQAKQENANFDEFRIVTAMQVPSVYRVK